MIANWLKDHLVAIGAWNPDGVSRTAKVGPHKCGALVVIGLDGHTCAGAATCDPEPLSVLGEALALLEGRSTYNLTRTAGRAELDHRSQFHITGSPPGHKDCDVVAAHRCHAPPLPTMPTAYQPIQRQELTDEPPY